MICLNCGQQMIDPFKEKESAQLQDKLHRRNMQIAAQKSRIEQRDYFITQLKEDLKIKISVIEQLEKDVWEFKNWSALLEEKLKLHQDRIAQLEKERVNR